MKKQRKTKYSPTEDNVWYAMLMGVLKPASRIYHVCNFVYAIAECYNRNSRDAKLLRLVAELLTIVPYNRPNQNSVKDSVIIYLTEIVKQQREEREKTTGYSHTPELDGKS